MSTFEVLTIMFVAVNFVIALAMLVIELIKSTKNSRQHFGQSTSYFLYNSVCKIKLDTE